MNSLFDLFVKIGADDSELRSAINESGNATEGLSAKSIAMGQVIADAFETALSKAVEFGKAIVDVGMEQETAIAKVATIMETDLSKGGMALEDMQKDIRDLSSQMGVSVADMSDAVYNAISATGDTAGAIGLVEQATKLATGGFADTSDALGVLTTAMNAYGDSAGTAEHISDSLMVVQNKGVTTVGELSSVMGKAIASGSAYGVNLENLESAYISLTKAGINTAEGTTYLSSMMKELGDDGSNVSKILKESVDKSFSDLMAEGASLGDVLDILNTAVGGDSTALMNLWSSAEAGKASSAIMSQGIEAFNNNLQELQTTSGTTEEAYATMADTMEHKTAVFKENIANKMGEIFTALEPIITKLMEVFESDIMPLMDTAVDKIVEFAPIIAGQIEPAIDTFVGVIKDNVIPAIQWIKDNMDTIAPIVAGVVAGFLAFQAITGIISAVSTAMAILNAVMLMNPIVLIVALIVGLGVALYELYQKNETFRNGVQALWEGIKTFIGNAVNALVEFFTVKIPDALNRMHTFFAELPAKISTAFTNVITKVQSFIADLKNKLTTGAQNAVNSFIGFFKNLPSQMAQIGKNIVDGLWNGISSGWSWLTDKVSNLAKSLLDSAKNALGIHSPSKEFMKIGEYCVAGFNEGFKALGDGDVFDGMTASLRSMQNGTNGMGFGGYTQIINVNQQIATADELARVMRTESRYGLMRGVALG